MKILPLALALLGLSTAAQASTQGCAQVGWSSNGTASMVAAFEAGNRPWPVDALFQISVPEPSDPGGGCDRYHISDLTSATLTVSGVPDFESYEDFWSGVLINGQSGSGMFSGAQYTVTFPAHPAVNANDFGAPTMPFVRVGMSSFRFIDYGPYDFQWSASGRHYYVPLPATGWLLLGGLGALSAFHRRRGD